MEAANRCPNCDSEEHRSLFACELFELSKCRVCGLTFLSRSAPVRYDEVYFTEQRTTYYDNYRRDYDPREFPVPVYTRLLEKLDTLQTGPEKKLLEVGCAKGIFLDVAAKRGWEAVGIDSSSYCVDYVRRWFPYQVYHTRLEDAGFQDGSFEAVVAIDVIEHLERPGVLFETAARLLREGGMLVILTPDEDSFVNRTARWIYRASLKRVTFPIRANHGPDHKVYFSPVLLDLMAARHRFQYQSGYHYSIPPSRMGFSPLVTLATKAAFFISRVCDGEHKMARFYRLGRPA